ncbi:hypothetical protein bcCo53_001238 (plasmid) [Borrelia coriaceae]|uniref:Lipoprotein n=1 Tax=Borrelia coriaceae ATCC 43381 TaxID=1408429 RepID=W5SW76_9SPIR|nr:hypothetical protein [Borrelia coriaceae]AHH11190.1 Hypothetical protein BCO_0004403 [Borrelia coriaceae ATCC 43381]UPA17069.1 hypothetical protein bcCo53_001238 [Borrelia coriaceae]
MLGAKRFSLLIALILMLLLLLISCNPNISSMHDNKSKDLLGLGKEDGHEFKFKELFDKFGLPLDDQVVVDNIKKIVTDPNIGVDEGYRTYNDLEFYNLLNVLGPIRLKEMIENYCEVDKRQRELQDAFERVLNNMINIKKVGQLQAVLNTNIDNYLLQVKKLFNYFSADDVYAQIVDEDNIARMIERATVQISRLRLYIRGDADANDVYLQLSVSEQDAIDAIKRIVTDRSVADGYNYKTYTDSEFYDLLNLLDIFKVKRMIKAYVRQVKILDSDYAVAKAAVESLESVEVRQRLLVIMKHFYDHYKVVIKSIFNDSKENSESICQKLLDLNYDAKFINAINIARTVNRFEAIFENLLDDQKSVLEYIQNIGLPSSLILNFKIIVANLGALKVKEIMSFHAEVFLAKESAKAALANTSSFPSKIALEKQFNELEYDYHLYLKKCFQGAGYANEIDKLTASSKYIRDFNKIEETVLNLY